MTAHPHLLVPTLMPANLPALTLPALAETANRLTALAALPTPDARRHPHALSPTAPEMVAQLKLAQLTTAKTVRPSALDLLAKVPTVSRLSATLPAPTAPALSPTTALSTTAQVLPASR